MEPTFWTMFGWGFAVVAGGGFALVIPFALVLGMVLLVVFLLAKL